MINIRKSQPAPECLAEEKAKKNGSYRCRDVLTRVRDDFHNKCYICEAKGPTSINVEHFVPHRRDKDLMFDWNNLFFACGHCNGCKLAVREFDNIMDCTDASTFLLDVMQFELKPYPKEVTQIKALSQEEKVKNTVSLLQKVYNGTHTEIKSAESDNLRQLILREILDFQGLLMEYFDDTLSEEEKALVRSNIQRKLSLKAPFTAFKYWIIKNNLHLLQEFRELLPQSA